VTTTLLAQQRMTEQLQIKYEQPPEQQKFLPQTLPSFTLPNASSSSITQISSSPLQSSGEQQQQQQQQQQHGIAAIKRRTEGLKIR